MKKRIVCLFFAIILMLGSGSTPFESVYTPDIAYAFTETGDAQPVNAVPQEITAELSVVSGSVSIENASAGSEFISGRVTVASGTTIKTGEGACAELSFSDGSGFRIQENTTLLIKEMHGVAVIPDEGAPFSSIESVIVELPSGKIYGDLAPALYEIPQNEEPVRVEVDMPWGVAGIRGTVWSNEVSNDTQITSVLRGKVEVRSQERSVYVTKGSLVKITPEDASLDRIEKFTELENENWENINDWVETREGIITDKESKADNTPGNTAPPEMNTADALLDSAADADLPDAKSKGLPAASEKNLLDENSNTAVSDPVDKVLPNGKVKDLPDETDKVQPNDKDKDLPDETDKVQPNDKEKYLPDEIEKVQPNDIDKDLPDETDKVLPEDKEKDLPDETDKVLPDDNHKDLPGETDKVLPDDNHKDLPDETEPGDRDKDLHDETEKDLPDETDKVLPDDKDKDLPDDAATPDDKEK